MLVSLSIRNFALIEKSSIDFASGFTTITGETGAGKSILLGALALLLGKRAEQSVLKDKDEKCVVEGTFQIDDYGLQTFFDQAGLDYDDHTIIRREVLPTGKSRAFVNDSPVNLQDLGQLAERLVDIHSQQQTRDLTDDSIQIDILDAVAGHNQLLTAYRLALKQYRSDKSKLESLTLQLASSTKEQDYNDFQLQELVEAQLVAGSQEELEQSLNRMQNVGLIRDSFSRILQASDNEQIGARLRLQEIRSQLGKLSQLSESYAELSERMDSLFIDFEDITAEISEAASDLTDDPLEMEKVSARLEKIYNLQRKHQVGSIEELLAVQQMLERKLHSLEDLQFDIDQLQKSLSEQESLLLKLASEINVNRSNVIPTLTERLLAILADLGMPDAQFLITLQDAGAFRSHGRDEIEFKFSANKGATPGLLKKVASGGEMSRIMLAIKSVMADYYKLPTIIFDEIDTGVSGEIANSMGNIMQRMSGSMQVFAITHLPQVAAKGDRQFRVFKQVVGGQTQSDLKLLDTEERVLEIAEMLSGKAPTDSAINHAKALLS